MCKTLMIAATCMMPVAAEAMPWERMETRGIVSHTLQAEDMRLTLVCDPNNAYEYPQQYLLFRFAQDAQARQVVLESANREIELPLMADSLLKPLAEEDVWAAALEILSSGEPFTIKADEQSWIMTPDSQPDHGCTS